MHFQSSTEFIKESDGIMAVGELSEYELYIFESIIYIFSG